MYSEFDQKPTKQELAQQKRKKQQQATMLIALLIIGGLAFYFLSYLPDEKQNAKEEIEESFKDNWNVTADKLDKSLWADSESWEEYLDSLFLPSQVNAFKDKVLKGIEAKADELEQEEKDRPRKMREEATDSIKSACEKEELEMPEVQKIIEEFTKKINSAVLEELDKTKGQAKKLIEQERFKRQKLHWRRKEYNWIDRKLIEMKDVYDEALTRKQKDGINKATFAAPYTIHFPPSLWNELTEEQKSHERASELTLRDDVHTYKFNDKINEWYDKVKIDPIRGEKDSDTKKDNNALFYGTGGTGKSISVEKLAYEADAYPLVIVKGLALTPKLPDQKCNIAVTEKFFFTIADITWTLVDEFGFERAEGGEVRYILFIDEADQISENSFAKESTGLTFLKECMGSDDYKKNESWNLWIAATNHLEKIDPAVYRPGRLSNPLDFSWTLGDFIRYADDAGISSQFPTHWTETKTLNDEDNKWVNRFNKDYFDAEFLPFWEKFISNNPNAEYEPEKDGENQEVNNNNNSNEPKDKKMKIKLGEFFEFFWKLKDSSQLEHFDGKFETPRNPKLEEVLTGVDKSIIQTTNKLSKDVSTAIETRLNELNDTAKDIRDEIRVGQDNMNRDLSRTLDRIDSHLTDIGEKIGGRSSSYY